MNIEQLRKDTPGTAKVIHLNNAGAALVPQVVLDCQIDYLKQEAMMGPYEAANAAHEDFEKIYMSIARMLGAKPDEIALQENATVAWNNAFAAMTFQPGDKILTGENEYASNYMNFLLAQKRYGVEIVVVPSDLSGQIDVEEMAKLIDKKVKLIAITHIPTNGGLIQPAAAVGKLAKAAGITYLLDACQSAGQMVLDVEAIGCDLLSATGRKWLRGPRGTGFLYVRQGLLEKLEPATLDLHSANWVAKDRYVMQPNAKRFENWEFNYAACLGLGKAVDYALALGFASIETRVQWLARRLRHILAEEMRLPVYDLGEEKGGIVTFSVPDRSADQVKADLAAKGINVSTSTASGTRLDAERRGLPDLVRASPHYYNTEEDLSSLARTIGKTRKISA